MQAYILGIILFTKGIAMKKFTVYIAMLTMGASAVAGGLDTYVLKNGKVKPFTSVTVDSAIKATLTCGEKNTVKLTSNKFLKGIAKTNKQGVLHVSFDLPPMAFIPEKGVYTARITTTAPIDNVHVDYGANMIVENCAADTFNVNVQHNSGAVINGDSKIVNITASAGSLVALTGNGNNTVNASLDKKSELTVCQVNRLVAKATEHSTVIVENCAVDTFNVNVQHNSGAVINSDSKIINITASAGSLVALTGNGNNIVNASLDKKSELAVCQVNRLIAKATGHSTILTEKVNSQMVASDGKVVKAKNPCGALIKKINAKRQKPQSDRAKKSAH